MRNTIITGAAAIALAAPAFAGAPVTYTAPTPAPAPSNLGLSGSIGLAYQNEYAFRGASDIFQQVEEDGMSFDNVIIANINADYAFTDNLSVVAGATIRTIPDGYTDHNTYRVGVAWKQEDCFKVEVGYQYQDVRGMFEGRGDGDFDEIYANASAVCPWTGIDFNLFWAHSLSAASEASSGSNDYDILDGDYIELSGHKSFELTDWASVDLTLGVSYAIDYWSDSSDFNSWYATLALPLKATEYLTVTPYVTYMDGLGAMEDTFNTSGSSSLDEGDSFLWGVQASVNF